MPHSVGGSSHREDLRQEWNRSDAQRIDDERAAAAHASGAHAQGTHGGGSAPASWEAHHAAPAGMPPFDPHRLTSRAGRLHRRIGVAASLLKSGWKAGKAGAPVLKEVMGDLRTKDTLSPDTVQGVKHFVQNEGRHFFQALRKAIDELGRMHEEKLHDPVHEQKKKIAFIETMGKLKAMEELAKAKAQAELDSARFAAQITR